MGAELELAAEAAEAVEAVEAVLGQQEVGIVRRLRLAEEAVVAVVAAVAAVAVEVAVVAEHIGVRQPHPAVAEGAGVVDGGVPLYHQGKNNILLNRGARVAVRLGQPCLRKYNRQQFCRSEMGRPATLYVCRGTFWNGILTRTVILREIVPHLNCQSH